MAKQLPDMFFWHRTEAGETKNFKCIFLGADNVYSLFDPAKFGFQPMEIHSACYKGFVVTFALREDRLFMDRLEIFTRDGRYPVLNGKESIFNLATGFHEYNRLNMPLIYTGTMEVIECYDVAVEIAAGTDGAPTAYKGPFGDEPVYELRFREGVLTGHEKIGVYSQFGF